MLDSIFVYGTLRSTSAAPMAREFARNATLVGPARMRGRTIDLGRYPGLLEPAGPDDWVEGELWRFQAPETYLPILDAYEGCGPDDPQPHEYKRVIRETIFEAGDALDAWVYLYIRAR
jgi:gamma-glutamylcyclotransferase (GGCT)/AIG2-like uncharacterized protein YtfP